ncbi:unnamed protein product [Trichogramma brassicae]|uniref:Uncharacterized protein n=1 Tax=Trichogramma brassicae TaxID=86971 RepID=A0A6H5J8D4_9HYME|nr:unnamed protein product [Trichogramma brassicae]
MTHGFGGALGCRAGYVLRLPEVWGEGGEDSATRSRLSLPKHPPIFVLIRRFLTGGSSATTADRNERKRREINSRRGGALAQRERVRATYASEHELTRQSSLGAIFERHAQVEFTIIVSPLHIARAFDNNCVTSATNRSVNYCLLKPWSEEILRQGGFDRYEWEYSETRRHESSASTWLRNGIKQKETRIPAPVGLTQVKTQLKTQGQVPFPL